MQSQILRPSKKRLLVMLAGSLAFVGIGFLTRHESALAWLPIMVFGVASIVFILLLSPNASLLRLDDQGITVVILYRALTLKWSEVTAFSQGRMGTHAMVFIDLAPGSAENPKLRRLAVGLSGHGGALPDTYGMSASELAALLTRLKESHDEPA